MPRTLPAPVAGLVASPGLSGSTTLPALMFTVPSPRAFAVNLIEKVSAATVAIETAVMKMQPRKARMGFTPSVPGLAERMCQSPDRSMAALPPATAVVHEVPRVVDRHDHHDEAAQHVDGRQAGRRLLRGPRREVPPSADADQPAQQGRDALFRR